MGNVQIKPNEIINDGQATNTLNTTIAPGFTNGQYRQYQLGHGEYQIQTATGAIWDIEFVCTGNNYSLGTTERRWGKGWWSRRYNGSDTIYTTQSGSNFFMGDNSFTSGYVGVNITSSGASTAVFELHESGSSAPSAAVFLLNVYNFTGTCDISKITNGPSSNYTTNPY
jgi:hypothetical protein